MSVDTMRCEACGSSRRVGFSTYFDCDLCERCYRDAIDRLKVIDMQPLELDGVAIQPTLTIGG